MDRRDGRYWKLGVFYFNRDDPDVLVPKRVFGRTLNYARPAAWAWTVGGLALVFLISFLVRH